VQQVLRPVPAAATYGNIAPTAVPAHSEIIYGAGPAVTMDSIQETVAPPGEIMAVTGPGSALPEQIREGAGLEMQPPTDRVISQYETATGGASQAGDAGTVKVNSKRLNFNYDLRDIGPSGVSTVDVWYTREGQGWQKFDRGIQQAGGTVEVDEEGVYGISFIPRTGFGGGKEPPAKGENPQMWVEVDTTKPSVTLIGIQPSAGGRVLRIDWSASDKNLTRKPVVLSYAEQKTGPWIPFTVPMDNTGTYVWNIPPNTPTSMYLRVEAADQAGNLGISESESPIRVDLAQPNVTNIRVTPLGQ
jgi:hypothetical protein